MEKVCTKCGVKKGLDDFYRRKRSNDGRISQCKECRADQKKKYIKDNKEALAEYKKKYYEENKEALAERNKKYYEENKEAIAEQKKKYREENKEWYKKYREENKEAIAEWQKKYYEENKEALADRQKKYMRDRKISDPPFRLKENIRCSIYNSLKNSGYKKTSRTYKILGCKYKKFMIHLNSNKYNFKYEDGLYDIDHIVPISSASTEEEILKLNHYTNFQLLPSDYNRNIKRDNPWDQEHFEKWMEETDYVKSLSL